MPREYFHAYHSFLTFIQPYSDAERGRLFTALLEYSMTGKEPELSGNERFIFPSMRFFIDRDKAAYDDKCRQNKANASERKRTQANASERSQYKDKDEDKYKYKDEGDIRGDSGSRRSSPKSATPSRDMQEIISLYNSICVSLPKVTSVNKERAKAIAARCSDLSYDLDKLTCFFERVEASDFLTGRNQNNGRDWKASFDWIMKESNFQKISEGNYDNREQPQNGRYEPTYDISEIEKMLDAEWNTEGQPEMIGDNVID